MIGARSGYNTLGRTTSNVNLKHMWHRVRALNLALCKLTQLATQMDKSRRALNDLRSIRRLLLTERRHRDSE